MDDTGVLTDDDLTALRRAAALAHTVGAITLRLRAGGPAGPVAATVVPRTLERHEMFEHPAGAVLDPCGFRMAVARAWADHRSGRRVGFAAPPGKAGPLELDWSIDAPGRLLGFGAVRLASAGRMVWAMASLLAPPELADVLAGFDDVDEPGRRLTDADDLEVRLVHDDLLDISVVHVEAKPTWMPWMVPVLDEAMRRLVASAAAAELLTSFAASAA